MFSVCAGTVRRPKLQGEGISRDERTTMAFHELLAEARVRDLLHAWAKARPNATRAQQAGSEAKDLDPLLRLPAL